MHFQVIHARSGNNHRSAIQNHTSIQAAFQRIDWIDFYSDGSLQIARGFGVVPEDSHLHWTTPLVLGGSVNLANLGIVPRDKHHVGHAKLWAQVSGLPPGTEVVTRRG